MIHIQINENDGYGTIILPEIIGHDNAYASAFPKAQQALYDNGYETIEVDDHRLKMIHITRIGSFVVFQKKLKEHGGETIAKNIDKCIYL